MFLKEPERFPYDPEKHIAKCLKVDGFDANNLSQSLIEYVPMHEFRVATKEKPLLFVDNLQCCVALYAHSPNFGFAAHINTKAIRGDDFYVDENGKPIKCKRTEDLYDAIVNSSVKFNQPVKIGISVGCIYPGDDYPTMKMIFEGIEEIMQKLQKQGISSQRTESQNAMDFILDTSNGEIILPTKNDTPIRKLEHGQKPPKIR